MILPSLAFCVKSVSRGISIKPYHQRLAPQCLRDRCSSISSVWSASSSSTFSFSNRLSRRHRRMLDSSSNFSSSSSSSSSCAAAGGFFNRATAVDSKNDDDASSSDTEDDPLADCLQDPEWFQAENQRCHDTLLLDSSEQAHLVHTLLSWNGIGLSGSCAASDEEENSDFHDEFEEEEEEESEEEEEQGAAALRLVAPPSITPKWVYYRRRGVDSNSCSDSSSNSSVYSTMGGNLPLICRAPRNSQSTLLQDGQAALPAGEVVLLNPYRADGPFADADYLGIGEVRPNSDHSVVAFTVDSVGDEQYQLYLVHGETGAIAQVPTTHPVSGFAWCNSASGCLAYTTSDECGRADAVRVLKFDLSQSPDKAVVSKGGVLAPIEDDVQIFSETDEDFVVELHGSKSGNHVIIHSGSQVSSEVYIVNGHDPLSGEPASVAPRREQTMLFAFPYNDEYLIGTTNAGGSAARNFQAVRLPMPGSASKEAGGHVDHVIVPPPQDGAIVDMDLFRKQLVLFEVVRGKWRVRVVPLKQDGSAAEEPWEVPVPLDGLGTLTPESDLDWESDKFYFTFSSSSHPDTMYEVDCSSRKVSQVWSKPLHGSLAQLWPELDIVCDQMDVTSADGTIVPMTYVCRRELLLGDSAATESPDSDMDESDSDDIGGIPTVLRVYGAYGESISPKFDVGDAFLLEQGWLLAWGHVRGGGELGADWWDGGRMFRKQATFEDTIACAKALTVDENGPSTPDLLCIQGSSAGGLAAAAAVNMAPNLFAGALLQVPFVDPLSTMLDEDDSFARYEVTEWGDPVYDSAARDVIESYSPFQNVRRGEQYPRTLVTGAVHDTRVPLSNAARYVLRLRRRAARSSEGADAAQDMFAAAWPSFLGEVARKEDFLLSTRLLGGHFEDDGDHNSVVSTARNIAFLHWATDLPLPNGDDSEDDEEHDGY